MPTRDVLIVAPSYLPSSYPPVHRVRLSVRHLPAFGWRAHVLTVDPRFFEEHLDPEIERLHDVRAPIHRVPAVPARLSRLIGLGELGIRAYPFLRRALYRLCDEIHPDVLFIPGPPWHPFRLGRELLDRRGIPYVLDYQDPWVGSFGAQAPPWSKAYWYRRLSAALEPASVRGAAHIIAVSDGTNQLLRARYPDLPEWRCSALPFGYEPTDFDAVAERDRDVSAWRDDGRSIHVLYAGAVHARAGKVVDALMAGVARLRAIAPSLYARLRLHFVGSSYSYRGGTSCVAAAAAAHDVTALVDESAARLPSYLDVLGLLRRADVLLTLGTDEPHYTASKIFPYILARRPLLTIFHDASSVCEIVRDARVGELVTFAAEDPVGEKVDAIATALARAASGQTPTEPRAESVARYSAHAITGRLASIFATAAGHGAVSPPDEAYPAFDALTRTI